MTRQSDPSDGLKSNTRIHFSKFRRSTRRALHNFLNLRKAHHARTVSLTNPVAAVKTAAVAELADATNASTHLRIAPKAAA